MKIKSFIILFSFFFTQFLHAQKEANVWYFGNKAGLDFNSGKPRALSNGKLVENLCGSTMSTPNGRLLLYTNGVDVWDSTHKIMPNGFGLKGHGEAMQTALIVPNPGNSQIFYIFTTSRFSKSNGFMYSELDMYLDSNKGDIVSGKKNIQLVDSVCEKIASVRHANGKDYWVVTHKLNSDKIYSYLITSVGICKTPIISNTGIFVGSTEAQMKISPDGKKIGYTTSKTYAVLADFSTSTGKISNIWQFLGVTALEFSKTSSYLYVLEPNGGIYNKLIQYHVKANSKQAFLDSKKVINLNKYIYYNIGIQLAPDGKIYIPEYVSSYLHVINAPDSAGKACRLQLDYIFLGGKKGGSSYAQLSESGLPGFISSYLGRDFSLATNCSNDSVSFIISNRNQIDSVLWNFGDTISEKNNISKKRTNISHIYSKSGQYRVGLMIYYNNQIDTAFHTFYFNKFNKPFIGNDTNICSSFNLKLSPQKDYLSYKWSNGNSSKTININSKGIYTLTVFDSLGCSKSDTIIINNPKIFANFNISDSIQCFKNDFLEFKETTTYIDDSRKQSTFYFFDGSSTDSIIKKTFPIKGKYKILLVAESKKGCIESIIKNINVADGILASIGKDTIICNKFKLYLSPQKDYANYKWNSGSSSKRIEVSSKGTYFLTVSDSLGCISSDTIIIKNPIMSADFTISDSIQCFKNNYFEFKETTNNKNDSKKQSTFYFFDGNSNDSIVKRSFPNEGKYTITLIAESKEGCTDSKTKTVELRPKSITEFKTADVCETDSVTFINQSQNAEAYNWKFGDGEYSTKISPKHFYKINGVSQTYNVTLVSILSGGCSDSIINVVTINANPKSNFTFSKSGNVFNFTPSQSGNTKYRWLFGDGDSAIAGTTSHTYKDGLSSHTVCLKATNVANCISETCKLLATTGIYYTKTSGFKIYPNPNTGNFTIELDNPEKDMSIEIYNLLGERVKNVERVGKVTLIDLEVASGIYLVKVRNGNNLYFHKVKIIN